MYNDCVRSNEVSAQTKRLKMVAGRVGGVFMVILNKGGKQYTYLSNSSDWYRAD